MIALDSRLNVKYEIKMNRIHGWDRKNNNTYIVKLPKMLLNNHKFKLAINVKYPELK